MTIYQAYIVSVCMIRSSVTNHIDCGFPLFDCLSTFVIKIVSCNFDIVILSFICEHIWDIVDEFHLIIGHMPFLCMYCPHLFTNRCCVLVFKLNQSFVLTTHCWLHWCFSKDPCVAFFSAAFPASQFTLLQVLMRQGNHLIDSTVGCTLFSCPVFWHRQLCVDGLACKVGNSWT